MDLTKSELNVLEILLNSDKALSKSEILEVSPTSKPWKDSTIHIILNSLLKKKAICEAGYIRTGKGFGRTFKPTKDGENYFAHLVLDITKNTSITKLFSTLIKNNALTDSELDELEQLLSSRK